MPSKSRLFSQLIASSGQIKAEKLSDDISTIEQVSSTDNLSSVGNVIGDQRVVGNTLYIWNGSGWYRIALINETPTWDSGSQPLSSYELDADSPQDATVITLAASDPDGLPISYSYVTSGSMDSMATISQDSSVFTVTPKTISEVGEGVELTGSITFRASDGVNILPSVSSFTLSFISIIENSKYTTLLATAVDTSDNNNITDSSSNNHTITVTGDVHAGTFSPYRHGGYSTYFDGNGDYLSIPSHADFRHDQGDWTIDGWFYPTSFASATCVLSLGTYVGVDNWIIYITSTGGVGYEAGNGTSWAALANYNSSSNLVSLNQWHHIAWVRSNGSLFIYLNGTRILNQASASFGVNSSGNLYIGNYFGQATTNVQAHYQSDLRIIKGTALYTDASFSLPTERPTAITNTKLLTCHLPYIIDGSSNAHTITANGNTSTKPFSPYDNVKYSAADYGGSIILDGSDNLKISSSSDFAYGTGDFTVEFWFYYTGAVPTNNNAFFWLQSGTNPQISLMLRTTTLIPYAYAPTQGDVLVANTAITPNTWQHHAMVRQGNTLTLYLDGNSIGSTTYTSDISSSAQMNIGSSNNNVQWVIGSLTDFRVVKGTAVYTGNFTPPTGPLTTTGGTYPSTTNVNTSITAGHTKLFLKGTDASIIDKSQGSNLKLVGNTTGSTTQVKFADTKSMYFDGAGDYITADQIPLGTGDFTIEAYTYLDSRLTIYPGIFSNYSTFSAGALSLIAGHQSSTVTNYQVAHNGTFPVLNAGPITYDQWVHLCLERYNGTITLYKDGTSIGSFSSTVALNGVGSNFYIGALGDAISSSYINGWIQDFRVTTGLARYTANFTPPTTPLEG